MKRKLSCCLLLSICAFFVLTGCNDDSSESDTDGDMDAQADGDMSEMEQVECRTDDSCLIRLLEESNVRECFLTNPDVDCLSYTQEEQDYVSFDDGRTIKTLCEEEADQTACDLILSVDGEKCGMIKLFSDANGEVTEYRYLTLDDDATEEDEGETYSVKLEGDNILVTCADESEESYTKAEFLACAAEVLPPAEPECATARTPHIYCASVSDCPDDDDRPVCINNICGSYDENTDGDDPDGDTTDGDTTDGDTTDGDTTDGDTTDGDAPEALTWTDPTTGYVWQKADFAYVQWNPAKTHCDDLVLDGHDDWHLPSIDELRTLIRGCPATQTGGSCNVKDGDCLTVYCKDNSCVGCGDGNGPDPQTGYWPDEMDGGRVLVWSSTAEVIPEKLGPYAWLVNFYYGAVDFGHQGHINYAVCMRN